MRSDTFTTTLSLSIGGDVPTWEGEAKVSFRVIWGQPETPPAYHHGGLPAEPDMVEDITVLEIDGKPGPWGDHKRESDMIAEAIVDAIDEQELLEFAQEQFF